MAKPRVEEGKTQDKPVASYSDIEKEVTKS